MAGDLNLPWIILRKFIILQKELECTCLEDLAQGRDLKDLHLKSSLGPSLIST